MPKIWVGRTTLNGEKREEGLRVRVKSMAGVYSTPYIRWGLTKKNIKRWCRVQNNKTVELLQNWLRVPRTVPWWLWFSLHPFAVRTLVWSSAEKNHNLCTSVTFLALKSACKAGEPYYSILEKEFSSCLSKCVINPQKTSSLNSQTQNQPGVSSDHKTDFLCPAVMERPLVNNNVVSCNEIFQRACEILERKNKTKVIIIPVSDFQGNGW